MAHTYLPTMAWARAITAGGANVIFDPVGGETFTESTRCIAFGGRLLVVGFASGSIASVATNIPLLKGFSVVGVRAGEYGKRFPEQGRENQTTIRSLAAEGRIRPHVHAELPLSRWHEAFSMLTERTVIGRVVLAPEHRAQVDAAPAAVHPSCLAGSTFRALLASAPCGSRHTWPPPEPGRPSASPFAPIRYPRRRNHGEHLLPARQ